MSKKRKKRKFTRKNIIYILLVCTIFVGVYFYINNANTQEIEENRLYTVNEPYQLLENYDTLGYLANILIEKNITILELSKTFYGKEIFWPYIIMANPNINNILDISAGTIIRIPDVEPVLLDTTDIENLKRVKSLSDSILEEISRNKKEELTNRISDF